MAITDIIPFRRTRRNRESLAVRPAADNPFLRLQEDMSSLFDDFFCGLPCGRGDLMRFRSGDWEFMPTVDVKESKRGISVTAELPGVDEDDLDVRLDGSTLTIRGETREERTDREDGWTRSECSYGSFSRSVPLGIEVEMDRVKATFRKGVLKVTLPKAKVHATDSARIEVKPG